MSTISSEIINVISNDWQLYKGNKERFKSATTETISYRRTVGYDEFDTLVLAQTPVWDQSSEYNLPLDPTPDAIFYPLTLHLHSMTEEQKKILKEKGFLKQDPKTHIYQIEIADFTLPPNAYDELLLDLGIPQNLINEIKKLCQAVPTPSSPNPPLIFSFSSQSSSEAHKKAFQEWNENGSFENFKNQLKNEYTFINTNPNSLITNLTVDKNYWETVDTGSIIPCYDLRITFNIKNLNDKTRNAFQEFSNRFSNTLYNTNNNGIVILCISDIQSDNEAAVEKLMLFDVPEWLLTKITMLCKSSDHGVKSQRENLKHNPEQIFSLREPPNETPHYSQDPSQKSSETQFKKK